MCRCVACSTLLDLWVLHLRVSHPAIGTGPGLFSVAVVKTHRPKAIYGRPGFTSCHTFQALTCHRECQGRRVRVCCCTKCHLQTGDSLTVGGEAREACRLVAPSRLTCTTQNCLSGDGVARGGLGLPTPINNLSAHTHPQVSPLQAVPQPGSPLRRLEAVSTVNTRSTVYLVPQCLRCWIKL